MPPARKRSRADLVDDEGEGKWLNEFSPRKEIPKTARSSSAKKRRLEVTPVSSANTSGLGSIEQTVSGISALTGISGQGKKDDSGDNEHADELANEEGSLEDDSTTRRKSSQKKKAARNSIFQNASITKKGELLSPILKSTSTLKKGKPNKPQSSIWDILVSDEEGEDEVTEIKETQKRRGRRPGPKPTSATKNAATVESIKRSPVRPRLSDLLKKERAVARQEKREKLALGEDSASEDQYILDKPKQRRKNRMDDKSPVPSDTSVVVSSNTITKGRRRKEADAEDSLRGVPKGILTPSRNRDTRTRKSVTFEGNGVDIDLGFKDIPSTASTKKTRTKSALVLLIESDKEVEEGAEFKGDNDPKIAINAPSKEDKEEAPEEVKELACAVCLKLHSRKGNQILMCDGCDFAAHQKCYDVPVIPSGDWFCKDCMPVVEDLSDSVSGLNSTDTRIEIPPIEGFEEDLEKMQRALLDKLTGQKPIRLCGHDEQMQKVHQVIEQTVLAGEGNSMLVIGGRGCGKTLLVESVISDVSAEYREKFHVVRLNGFIHTDDKLALREIWRQLGREMEVEGDLAEKTNYADTLASLLALLSHPSEISESSFEQTAKSVIFILDEFDLFTTHARQTLLYNLFDIAQAKKAPIAVLGLTTRIDVVESLEKRVKSRFSHRYVYLSLPRSPPMFWDICKEALTLTKDEAENEGFDLKPSSEINFLSYWNSMIDDLYMKDTDFKHHMQSCFYRTKSAPAFFATCILPIAGLSLKNLPLTGRTFLSSVLPLSPPDSKLHILQGLSDLELAILIAAARLDIILDTDTCNFSMVYDEYSSLTSRHKIQTSSTGVAALGSSAKVWGRDVALGAWERLAEYQLLVPAAIGGGGGRDFGAAGRMWKVDVGLEEICGSINSVTGVMAKWCREI